MRILRQAVVSAIFFTSSLAGCFEAARRPLGDTCQETDQCAAGECLGGVCLEPEADADSDGLINRAEHALGTNPLEADSDGDGVADLDEVGDVGAPRDGDGDGVVDALESAGDDRDGDCLRDQDDPLNDEPETDAATRGAKLCLREGVCGAGGATASCEGGESACDYSGVSGYEAEEVSCDGRDNDCDGEVDETFAEGGDVTLGDALSPDDDGKTLGDACGAGACAGGEVVCHPDDPRRLVCSGDEDASAPACDADADCDGVVDEGADLDGCSTFFADSDGDGFGVDGESACLCAASDAFRATEAGDCDDTNQAAKPGSLGVLCGEDADCDGRIHDPAEVCDDGDTDRFNGCDACEASALVLPVPEEGVSFGGLSGYPSEGWFALWSAYRAPIDSAVQQSYLRVQRFGRGGEDLGSASWFLGTDGSVIARVPVRNRLVVIGSNYSSTGGFMSLTRTLVQLDGNLFGRPNEPFTPFGDVPVTSFSVGHDPIGLPGGGALVTGQASYRRRDCPDGTCSVSFWLHLGPDGEVVRVQESLPPGIDPWTTRFTDADEAGFYALTPVWQDGGNEVWTVQFFAGLDARGREVLVYPCPADASCRDGAIARHGDGLLVAMNHTYYSEQISWGYTVAQRFSVDGGSPVGEPVYPFGPATPPAQGEPSRYPVRFELTATSPEVAWILPMNGYNAASLATVGPKDDGINLVDPVTVVAARLAGDGPRGIFTVRGLEKAYSVGCNPLVADELLCGGTLTRYETTPDGTQSILQDTFLWRFGPADGRVMVLTQRR